MTWALLPLKDLVRAKTRLAGLLAPSERRALAQAMVEDVLGALTACSQLEGVLLVTDDPAGRHPSTRIPHSSTGNPFGSPTSPMPAIDIQASV